MYIFPEGFWVRINIPCNTFFILSPGMPYTFGDLVPYFSIFYLLSYASLFVCLVLNDASTLVGH